MKCLKCGYKISNKFKLCPNCGEKVNLQKKKQKIKTNKNLNIILPIIILILFLVVIVVIFINNTTSYDVDELKSSVVMINVYDKDNQLIATGSGVVAFDDNIVLTNAHVIEDNYKLEVLSENNTKYQVEGVLDYNKRKDIAILKLVSSKGLKPVSIKQKINTGDKVVAIGSPLGLKNTISDGILSGLYQDNIEVYQHTAPISPGSSGGALFDKKGRLVGITYASLENGQNLNFAIPIAHYEKEYEITKDNVAIESQYYSWLKNPILKTNNGSKLLNYVLNDKFTNEKFKSGIISDDEFKRGNLDRCLSLSNCIFVADELYDKVKNNVSTSLFMRSGYADNGVYDATLHKSVSYEEGSYYAVVILKLNNDSNKSIKKAKDFINENFSFDFKIMNSNNYVYGFECKNYDDCDSVKKLINRIVK